MNILIVPAVSVREGEFVYPGEIQVIDYKDHVKEVCRLGSLLECAQGDLNQAMKISAYDEAKERELFESRWGFTDEEQEIYFIPELNCYGSARVNDAANNKSSAWYWWQACAKSRAGIQS